MVLIGPVLLTLALTAMVAATSSPPTVMALLKLVVPAPPKRSVLFASPLMLSVPDALFRLPLPLTTKPAPSVRAAVLLSCKVAPEAMATEVVSDALLVLAASVPAVTLKVPAVAVMPVVLVVTVAPGALTLKAPSRVQALDRFQKLPPALALTVTPLPRFKEGVPL